MTAGGAPKGGYRRRAVCVGGCRGDQGGPSLGTDHCKINLTYLYKPKMRVGDIRPERQRMPIVYTA